MADDSWLDDTLEFEDPIYREQEDQANPRPAKPFTIRQWSDIHDMDLPPLEVFLDRCFALGGLHAIVGQGGLGKSRISTNLARNNVLGLPFCGLSTGTRPLKWLFIGNENSTHRMQHDIRAMSKGLTPDQIRALHNHIFLQSLETVDDSFICLGDEDVRKRWKSTLGAVVPDVVVGDPWGEIAYGDANADADARNSIRTLVGICRKVNPRMAIVLPAHARTGRGNILQAVGYDRGNFAKGSKALHGTCRGIVNVAPADPEDSSRLVLACGKANDAPEFATRGIVLNSETMTYDVDPSFDLDAWVMDVEGKRSTGARLTLQDVVDACQETTKKSDLVARLEEEKGASKSTSYQWISKAIKNGLIREGKKGVKTTGKIPPRISTEGFDAEDFTK